MKYLYTILLTFALLALPATTFAQSVEFRVIDKDGMVQQKGDMIPIEKYVELELSQFNTYIQQPGRSNEELSEAISDLIYVLEVYIGTLQD